MPLELINPITYTDITSVTQSSLVVPAGTIISSVSHTRPTGFLLCDGSNDVSRTTYSNLFNAIVPNKGTVTITIATPGVVTLNSHGFLTGESIYLNTTGTLPTASPTGLSVNTLYYVITINANTFSLATSYANAIAGTALNTTAVGNGIHTLFYCPYGLGNNTSNFKLPDLKNATIRGRGSSTAFTEPGTTRLGNLEDDSMQGHVHNFTDSFFSAGGGAAVGGNAFWGTNSTQTSTTATPTNSGNGTPRTGNETRMKNQGVNFFIKF